MAEDQPHKSANAAPLSQYVSPSELVLVNNAGGSVFPSSPSSPASDLPASPGADYESDGSNNSSHAQYLANGLHATAQQPVCGPERAGSMSPPSQATLCDARHLRMKATKASNDCTVNVVPVKEQAGPSASRKRKQADNGEHSDLQAALSGPRTKRKKPGKKAATAAEYDAKGVRHQRCMVAGCCKPVSIKNRAPRMRYGFLLASVASLADLATPFRDHRSEYIYCDVNGCSYKSTRPDNLETHETNVHKVVKPTKSGSRSTKAV